MWSIPFVPWEFSGKFCSDISGHFLIFPGHFPDFSRTFPGIVRESFPEISRKLAGHFSDIYRTFIGFLLENFRKFPEIFPDVFWNCSGNFQEFSWKLPRNFLDISRKFPEHFPDMSRTFPELFWQCTFFSRFFPDISRHITVLQTQRTGRKKDSQPGVRPSYHFLMILCTSLHSLAVIVYFRRFA